VTLTPYINAGTRTDSTPAAFDINAAIADLIAREGGYSNNPNDAGGETCFGITEAVARAYGYTGEMVDLSVEFATDVPAALRRPGP
jgi:lysozyme family protein